MGSLFGSSKSKSESHPDVYGPQKPYINETFSEAQRLYNDQKGSPSYQGSTYASLNPMQQSTLDNMFRAGGSFTSAGMAGLTPGLANLNASGSFGANANALYGMAGNDPTEAIVNNAGRYASNPYMDSMVDASSRDVVRNLNENDLPQLNDSASASGNAYSSRTGVAEGIMRRGAADRVADIGASMRGQAFQSGLGMAQDQYNRSFDNLMGANAAIGNAGSLGSSLVGSAAANAGAGFDMQSTAGNAYQQDSQGQLDEQAQKWSESDQRPWELLDRYFNFSGWGGGPGTASSSKTSQSLGIIPGILGTASAIGSLGSAAGLWGRGR
ncbi:hypothetical protein FHP25_33975 [Vineibacter terrae]|uniref:Uncharacterized protein n=1 Tax=Vineibacter terrae TaxID=2586908 RepID=A0A5C8P9R8_9HYPH|nr:hypothetical protein [Vineibacter terrae]TXL70545.1 hypothetical protein FHP25_33975 [Vineibacter terrae]